MISGIKINGLRSLDFNDYVDILPLTVLIGKNSSGKSTFLRTFPLIKQSLETKKSAPLLWYGRLIDFGGFEESRYKNETKDFPIKLGFIVNKNSEEELKINISLMKEENIEYLSDFNIDTKNNQINIKLNKNKEIKEVKINNETIKLFEKCTVEYFKGLFPEKIIFNNLYRRRPGEQYERELNQYVKEIFQISVSGKLVTEERILRNIVRQSPFFRFIDRNLLAITEERIFLRLKSYLDRERNRGLFSSNEIDEMTEADITWNKEIQFEDVKKKIFLLRNLMIFYNLEIIFSELNEKINNSFHNISYIAPLRATAERYYRIQGLDVEEISPDGSNLAMYLKNLSPEKLGDFFEWVYENFNFELELTDGKGHISIGIKQGESINNLTDTGFGFSQILPIIVQIWIEINKIEKMEKLSYRYRRKEAEQIFVIEQPELHLHPAMQAMLMDAIIKSIKIAKKEKVEVKFIIETHSETIINRIGRHILENSLNETEINLLIFEKDKNNQTKVIESGFDSEGILEKWPLGFFEPGDILR